MGVLVGARQRGRGLVVPANCGHWRASWPVGRFPVPGWRRGVAAPNALQQQF